MDEYFENLDPDKIWLFDLQMDLAKETIIYTGTLNQIAELADENELVEIPYKFTMLETANAVKEIIRALQTTEDWELSPDTNGGVTALYLGTDFDILSMEYNELGCLRTEYIRDGCFEARVYSWEVPLEVKIMYLNYILEDVKSEELEVENNG